MFVLIAALFRPLNRMKMLLALDLQSDVIPYFYILFVVLGPGGMHSLINE